MLEHNLCLQWFARQWPMYIHRKTQIINKEKCAQFEICDEKNLDSYLQSQWWTTSQMNSKWRRSNPNLQNMRISAKEETRISQYPGEDTARSERLIRAGEAYSFCSLPFCMPYIVHMQLQTIKERTNGINIVFNFQIVIFNMKYFQNLY